MSNPRIYIEAERPSDTRMGKQPRVFARFWFIWPGHEPLCSGATVLAPETLDWIVERFNRDGTEIEVDLVTEDTAND